MFRAISRFFRAIGYLFTGKVDNARKDLARNPHVIQATFDRVVEDKKARIHQYKDAVARMIAQEETKKARIQELSTDIVRLNQLKEGAAAKAKTVVNQLKAQGQSEEQIKTHEDYVKSLAAFNDFTSSLKEKEGHVAELETDVKEISGTVANHKIQLQSLLREVDKIRQEADQTVADVITAREEAEINNMLVGIGEDRTSRELEDMRALRQESKAKARISREMAGTDTAVMENEFLEYARTGVATDEFDRLIGLAGSADKQSAPAERASDVKLPE